MSSISEVVGLLHRKIARVSRDDRWITFSETATEGDVGLLDLK